MLKIDRELLGRPLRVDEPIEELGISSYDRLREAVKAGDTGTALALIDYVQIEGKGLHDLYCDWVYGLLTWIADNCGEERLPEVLAYWKYRCMGYGSRRSNWCNGMRNRCGPTAPVRGSRATSPCERNRTASSSPLTPVAPAAGCAAGAR